MTDLTPDQRLNIAVAQARREERWNARLDNHDIDIRELRAGHAATTHTLGEISVKVGRIESAIAESAAAAKAVAEQLVKQGAADAEKQANSLTRRQLYMALGSTLLMFLIALAGLLLGIQGTG